MILTQIQAEAVYSSMCTLNNVGAKIKVNFGTVRGGVTVFETEHSDVHVVKIHNYDVIEDEVYTNQSEFAQAYQLS